ncbi:hypothetical protein Tco_1272230 [Tanacetum coccineum]
MDDDLFTYEVEVANILCDSNKDDDSEQRVSHEGDDDMGYDPSDVAFTEWLGGDDEVDFTDKELSDNEDEVVEVFRMDSNIFDFETPMCKTFNEFNYLLQIDPDLIDSRLMKNIRMIGSMNGTEMYHGLMRNYGLTLEGNLPGAYIIGNSLHYQDYEWYEALEDDKLKEEALRNNAIMEGFVNEDDDESRYERKKRWNVYTNYDYEYEMNHEVHEREELCEIHELPVSNIRRFEMIKYSFEQDEEYVSVEEDEYDDLARTSKDACRAYQEIFRMMDEGWMATRAEW